MFLYILTCSAIYRSRLFGCELPSFGIGGMDRRDACLLLTITELDWASLGVLKVPQKIHIITSTTGKREKLYFTFLGELSL